MVFDLAVSVLLQLAPAAAVLVFAAAGAFAHGDEPRLDARSINSESLSVVKAVAPRRKSRYDTLVEETDMTPITQNYQNVHERLTITVQRVPCRLLTDEAKKPIFSVYPVPGGEFD